METRDLYTRELRQLAPLKKGSKVEITPEVISEWAVEIAKQIFEDEEDG